VSSLYLATATADLPHPALSISDFQYPIPNSSQRHKLEIDIGNRQWSATLGPELQRKEVLDQSLAVLGQHAFWMELNTFDGKTLVPQAHDYA
jgi:hypothetical protein